MGIVRLFLALVVLAGHWYTIVLLPNGLPALNPYFTLGFNAGYAVLFFYVISGFLISYTLQANYRPTETGKFYFNRFIRIFSVYWPVAIIVLVVFPDAPKMFEVSGALDRLTKIFIIGQDWRFAFADYPGVHLNAAFTLIEQSWTLAAELTFYLLAPWLMRSYRAVIAVMVASFVARAAFVFTIGDLQSHPTWNYFFIGTTIGFFMIGQLAGLAYHHYPNMRHPRLYLLPGVLGIVIMTFGPWAGFDTVRLWAPIALFAVALPSLFQATKDSQLMNYLGNLSYPLYLLHVPMLVLFGAELFEIIGHPVLALMAFAAIAIAAAAVIHSIVEPLVAAGMRVSARATAAGFNSYLLPNYRRLRKSVTAGIPR